MSSQPEWETPPTTSVSTHPAGPSTTPIINEEVTPLTQSLRQSPDRLDGIFRRREPSASDSFIATKTERKYKKKTQKKVGAGRELNFSKEEPEMQKKLIATREKEWHNWKFYSDGRLVTEEEVVQMMANNPNLKIIPTRWVDVDKSEIGEPEKLKSRLVVRGDLEDSSLMRCDSPTCSQTMISLVLTLAACRNTKLWSGDISAAFLQGSKLDRTLILSLPKDGVPGVDPNMYYIVSSTVYGTRDTPRGWWKNLDGTLKKKGFLPVLFEPGAYTLLEKEGVLAGIVITHVDDLLWTGGTLVEARMKEVCDHYKSGKIKCDEFRYCGRNISRDAEKIYVKCDNLIDRVRPIWLTHEQKRHAEQPVSEGVRGQLRSIIGSLAWLSRVCRPDLAYAVCKMQMSVSSATYEDVKYANSIVALAQKTKEAGLAYPVGAFKFENVMILAIQDASHAADHEASSSGARMAHRSQSGRLLCLADRSFFESKTGRLALIEWHSTVLKRVCRSTLQSEALSLLAGSEEERLRFVLHGLRHPHCGQPHWQVSAMDGVLVE